MGPLRVPMTMRRTPFSLEACASTVPFSREISYLFAACDSSAALMPSMPVTTSSP